MVSGMVVVADPEVAGTDELVPVVAVTLEAVAREAAVVEVSDEVVPVVASGTVAVVELSPVVVSDVVPVMPEVVFVVSVVVKLEELPVVDTPSDI